MYNLPVWIVQQLGSDKPLMIVIIKMNFSVDSEENFVWTPRGNQSAPRGNWTEAIVVPINCGASAMVMPSSQFSVLDSVTYQKRSQKAWEKNAKHLSSSRHNDKGRDRRRERERGGVKSSQHWPLI